MPTYSARNIRSSLEEGTPRLEFELAAPGGTVPVRLALAGHAQSAQRARRGGGRPGGWCVARRCRGRPGRDEAGQGTPRVQTGGQRRRSRGRFLQRQPGLVEGRARRLPVVRRGAVAGAGRHDGARNSRRRAAREIGAYARESGVERLLAVGPRARCAADAFGPAGAWFETSRI